MADVCPFCGGDPYEYVDIGVGLQPVAITCCELGILYFDRRDDSRDTAEISLASLDQMADIFRSMRKLGMDFQITD